MWNCEFFLSKRSNCSNGPKRLLKINFTQEKKRKNLRVSCNCSCISLHKYQIMEKEDYREFLHTWFYYRIASWTEFASILRRLTAFISLINGWRGIKEIPLPEKKHFVILTQKSFTKFANWFCQAVYAFYQQQIFCLAIHIPGDAYMTRFCSWGMEKRNLCFSWIKMKTKGI